MAWQETCPVLERYSFIEEMLEGDESMAELCRRYGVSRKTGYKWRQRHELGGVAGLVNLPRVAKSLPHKTDVELERLIVKAKNARPTWGPKKLIKILQREHPHLVLPAPSTAGEILKRHGLVEARPRRRLSRIWRSPPLRKVMAPNDTWTIDFKGQFRLKRGPYCYPLTLHTAPAKTTLEAAFREFGLPFAMRSDNGSPFAANRGSLGLSELSLWWLKLGIRPERIDRGCPQQNGRHERMHRTLKAETTPQASLGGQQMSFDRFRCEFNEERPHEALHQEPPASIYVPSPRAMPYRLPAFEYDSAYEVRRVARNGFVSYSGERYFLSEVLSTENVGLLPLDDHSRELWIGVLPVGYLDLETKRFNPYEGRARRLEEALDIP